MWNDYTHEDNDWSSKLQKSHHLKTEMFNTHRSFSKHLTSKAEPKTAAIKAERVQPATAKLTSEARGWTPQGFGSSPPARLRLKIESGQRGCQRIQHCFLLFVFKRHKLNGPCGPQKIWGRSWQISFQSNAHTALFTSAGDCKQNSDENRKKCLGKWGKSAETVTDDAHRKCETLLTSLTLTALTKSGPILHPDPITDGGKEIWKKKINALS